MTTRNPYPTYSYSQPKEYQFSHDSVFFARRVYELTKHQDISKTRALDLCAGSGIVGLDYCFHLKKEGQTQPAAMDFLEVQECYHSHIVTNRMRLALEGLESRIWICSYSPENLSDLKNSYDLILSNPPYFPLGIGKLTASEVRNRCHFFMDASFEEFIKALILLLKPGGQAHFLARDLSMNGIDIKGEIQKLLEEESSKSIAHQSWALKEEQPIRGTLHLVLQAPL